MAMCELHRLFKCIRSVTWLSSWLQIWRLSESRCLAVRQSSDRTVQRGVRGEGLCLQAITSAFVPPFFLLHFNSGQNKFSFPEGIPCGKHWDAMVLVWLTQTLLKTLVARLIQRTPYWPPLTGKNRPSHIVWVQPCTLRPLLEALLSEKVLAVVCEKQMCPHKKRGHCPLWRGLSPHSLYV